MIPISLSHISKSFRRKFEVGASGTRRERREVLRDLDFDAEEGDIVCVLGKNGAGKTTLIRILSTLVIPDLGNAQICGFDVVRQSGQVRLRVGVMLNAGDSGFHPRLSGSYNLEYYSALYLMSKEKTSVRIDRLLRDMDLEDRGADQYQSYSSGMRRRLALARALLPDPPVLLLDEPTLGVDPWTTKLVHAYLTQLSRQGKTILCATNNLSEALELGNRLYVLENGCLSPWNKDEILAS